MKSARFALAVLLVLFSYFSISANRQTVGVKTVYCSELDSKEIGEACVAMVVEKAGRRRNNAKETRLLVLVDQIDTTAKSPVTKLATYVGGNAEVNLQDFCDISVLKMKDILESEIDRVAREGSLTQEHIKLPHTYLRICK